MKYYLAIDIGASSGRHILGCIQDGKLSFEEIYRFPNVIVKKDNLLCWDYDALFEEILYGLEMCAKIGKIPASIGIDTWGVDFVLLDGGNQLIGDTVAYRDNRTADMPEAVFARMPEAELYKRTGITTQPYNTIFQLMAVKHDTPELLDAAQTMLLTPNYLSYLLSGVAAAEYTIATTTGLVNAVSRDWDEEIIAACGFPRNIFPKIVPPGTVLGGLLPGIRELVGYDTQVVLPCCHDTGCAVMALPCADADPLYISSGTWSLLGVERTSPDCSPESMRLGFTNEGGYGGRYRYLQNIMGLWMIQCVKDELDDIYSFEQLCELAETAQIASIVNCNDLRFLSPERMIREIQAACRESGQQVPISPGELSIVIFSSLAACYRDAICALEKSTGVTYPAINIVGGGAFNMLLNRLTEQYTGKTVRAGPAEATSIGNLMTQMLADGSLSDLRSARECIGI